MTRLHIFVFVVLAGMVSWIVYAVVEGKYLEAVAISCIGPVLLWFMLGAGRGSRDQEEE
jgi:hypothetical protein